MTRLALANHLSLQQLRTHVGGRATAHPQPDWLAAAGGQPTPLLKARLYGLSQSDDRSFATQHKNSRPMCWQCMARRGVFEPVYCHLTDHQTVCQRHQRWIGPTAHRISDQDDLRNQPAVLAAARTHSRLVRRRSPAAATVAIREAKQILTYWANSETHSSATIFDKSQAAQIMLYPDLVNIATVLDQHRAAVGSKTFSPQTSWDQLLLTQINQRISKAHSNSGALEQWVYDQQLISAPHSRSRPASNYLTMSEWMRRRRK